MKKNIIEVIFAIKRALPDAIHGAISHGFTSTIARVPAHTMRKRDIQTLYAAVVAMDAAATDARVCWTNTADGVTVTVAPAAQAARA